VEQAGRDLDPLRRLRNRADYDDTPPLLESVVGDFGPSLTEMTFQVIGTGSQKDFGIRPRR
jgi:hypothetical protein